MVSPYSPISTVYILSSECIFKQSLKLWSFRTRYLDSPGYHSVTWTLARHHVLRRIDSIVPPIPNAGSDVPKYQKTYFWITPPNGKEFQLWGIESKQSNWAVNGTVQSDAPPASMLNPTSKKYHFHMPKGSILSFGYWLPDDYLDVGIQPYGTTNIWVEEL